MSLVKINWSPSGRQLRQFGLIALVALPLLGWFWSGGNWTAAGIGAAIGVALAVAGWFWPRAIKPVFLGLSLAAIPIGMVIGELAMLLVYCALFVPIGVFFRLIGRDALQRKFDREATTYWEPKSQPSDPAAYLRQS